MSVTTVMLVGVGGQGTILAADVLAKVAAANGLDVKLSEVHGMSQRGGSVDTVVRFGDVVHSPITGPGGADHLVAFELTEGARWLHYCKPAGRLVINERKIDPLPVLIGVEAGSTGIRAALEYEGAVLIDAEAVACGVGSPRSANVVLLGALSLGLPFDPEVWCDVIAKRVPAKTVESNLAAFRAGRAVCEMDEGCAT